MWGEVRVCCRGRNRLCRHRNPFDREPRLEGTCVGEGHEEEEEEPKCHQLHLKSAQVDAEVGKEGGEGGQEGADTEPEP